MMSRRNRILIVALLACVVGLLWFVAGRDGSGEAEPAVVAAPARPEAAPRPAERGDVVAPRDPAAPPAPAEVVAPDVRDAREVVASAASTVDSGASFDTAGAPTLDVTVEIPPGSPPDPTLRLVIVAGDEGGEPYFTGAVERYHVSRELGGDRTYQRVPVFGGEPVSFIVEESTPGERWDWAVVELDPSGIASVPFPEGAESAALMVTGRYLRSDVLTVGLDEAEEVRLDTRLGAWISGTCILPAGWESRGARPEEIELSLTSSGRPFFRRGGEGDSSPVRADLSFELRAVLEDQGDTLVAEVDGLAPGRVEDLEYAPGGHLVVDVALPLGAALRGRVLGPADEPVPDAEVALGSGPWDRASGGDTLSDEEGAFELLGVEPGKHVLEVEAAGWLSPDEQRLELSDGEERADLVIRLDRGAAIAGRVLWPDGSPAEGAEVTVAQTPEDRRGWRWKGAEQGATADGDGRFRVTGLTESACLVVAGLAPVAQVLGSEKELDEDGHEGPRWEARAEEVLPGGPEVLLTLTAPIDIVGRVVDDTGAPVTSFRVNASPEGERNPWGRGGGEVQATVEDAEGRFTLSGARPGAWTLDAEASGHGSLSPEVRVEIPQTEPVLLVLPRGATVSGRVVDPLGAPVANARVRRATGEERWWGRGGVETDELGAFELTDLSPRAYELTADHEDWAKSLPQLLELAPADAVEGLVLTLREGATITGQVLDERGEPLPGQGIHWGTGAANPGMAFGSEDELLSDADGRFVLERVDPGEVTVVATLSREAMEEMMREAEDESAFFDVMSKMKTAKVEVPDGGTAHVVLGATPRVPVRLFGTVTAGGAPVAGGRVIAIAEGGSLMKGMKMSPTDDDGAYEVTLDRPGNFRLLVGLRGSPSEFDLEHFETIPEVDELRLDLEVPMGSLAGIVREPDGKPARGVEVYLTREDGTLRLADLGPGADVETGVDGGFAFENLAPGAYTLHVGPRMPWRGESAWGSAIVPGIQVPDDGAARDVEVRLERAGRIEGRVVDGTGEPVPGAAVFVRDREGRLLSPLSNAVSDVAGRFDFGGVAPGEVTFSARSEDGASTESSPVQVASGGLTEVELVVEPAAYLVVQALVDGDPVRADLVITDESGRQYQLMFGMDELEKIFLEGFDSASRRIGPVPPGEYLVRATTTDGRTAKKKVRVREGQAERPVKLRLK
jgi:protocatechuate 3,4-dioxygenase beta subunit